MYVSYVKLVAHIEWNCTHLTHVHSTLYKYIHHHVIRTHHLSTFIITAHVRTWCS